jgi:hypothetical protein
MKRTEITDKTSEMRDAQVTVAPKGELHLSG